MGLMAWLGLTSTADQVGVLSPYVGSSHLEQVTLAHLLDLADGGAPVTRSQAMAIPSVARARNMICGLAGRPTPTGMAGMVTMPDQPAILVQPEGQSRARVLTQTWTMDALLFHGRAWWIVTDRHAVDGRPKTVRWVPEEHLTTDDEGAFRAYGKPVARRDVLRIDGPHEGLLNYGQTTLRAARLLSETYASRAASPVPVVELHQTGGDRMTRAEIAELVGRWVAARNSKDGAVAFTSPTVEARVHGQPAEQLLISGRKAVSLEVAQLCNLPAWAVDAEVSGSSMTYSNVPSRTGELIDYTITPYWDALAGRLSLDDVLPRGQWVRIPTETLTRPDFGARMAGYRAAQDANIYTAEQCRAIEAGTPMEGNPDA